MGSGGCFDVIWNKQARKRMQSVTILAFARIWTSNLRMLPRVTKEDLRGRLFAEWWRHRKDSPHGLTAGFPTWLVHRIPHMAQRSAVDLPRGISQDNGNEENSGNRDNQSNHAYQDSLVILYTVTSAVRNTCRSSCDVPLLVSDRNRNLDVCKKFSKTPQY